VSPEASRRSGIDVRILTADGHQPCGRLSEHHRQLDAQIVTDATSPPGPPGSDLVEVQSRRNVDGSGIGFFDSAGAPVVGKQPEHAILLEQQQTA
jgi:hypothetical protein